MKYCSNCGKEIMDDAVVCVSCGCAQNNAQGGAVKPVEDASSIGLGILGFCVPIAGLILYLVWKDTTPLKAKSAGKGALISFILGIVFYILYFIFIVALGIFASM